jgi:hypothetical protein
MIKVRIKKLPQARTGYQVQGALVNDVPSMGGADYNAYIGKPKLMASKYITAVPRDEANLEAEGGETVYGDINGDGIPEHQIIKGPRHHSGGVPLSLPEDTFIFSDTRGMLIKDPKILAMFGKGGTNKSFTPAELAKQYDIQKYRKILEDPDSDAIERKSAELMMKKYIIKLGCLALAQESMKGFPQGIPAVARPCMEARGITEEQILPAKEITVLNDQLKKQMNQQENSEETMESENQQNPMEEAQEMNQGQPIAQGQEQQMGQPQPQMSQEEMMMYGGMRRLRRAQEGMQQPSPEEMAMMQQQQQQQGQPQEQGGGEDEMMQVMQEVQAALERGAEPAEVVMSLIQNGIPPEAVVEIFTQLGASAEEATQLVQQVMSQGQEGQGQEMAQQPMSEEEAMMMQQQQQAPPMAQYGMSMGGYDMPFYDVPQAEYGMSMGAGMSQNYQGRSNRVPASGPITGMVKAQDGIIIKRSDYKTDAELQNALKRAYIQSKKSKQKIYIQNPDGKNVEQKVSATGHTEYKGDDIDKWNGNQVAAATFEAMSQTFNDPKAKAAFAKQVRATLNDKEAYKGKRGTYTKTYQEQFGKDPSTLTDDEIVKNYLRMQERNLKTTTYGQKIFGDAKMPYGSWMYKDANGDIRGYESSGDGQGDRRGFKDVVKAANPNLSDDQIKEMYTKINSSGYTSLEKVSADMGLPMQRAAGSGRAANPYDEEAYLQQAGFIAADRLMKDLDANPDNYDEDTQNALLGITSFAGFNPYGKQTGYNDEIGQSVTNISPIDAYYTNTTQDEKQAHHGLKFEDVGAIADPDCQCTDPSNTETYSPYKDAQGNCTCTPPENKVSCPCQKSDGTDIEMTANADGSCPPCTEDQDVNVPGQPASWWLQDTIKTLGAAGDLGRIKKYMGNSYQANLGTPRPTFIDPTRELSDNSEQANIQTQGMSQFAGSQKLSSISGSIQGQASKNAANTLSKYNNANVNIANQFEMKANDIRNQNSMLNQAGNQRLYDQNTVANQQFDNSKMAMRNQLRNYYTNGMTNRWKTDALNQMHENYKVNPGNGGEMAYNPTPKTVTGQGASSGKTAWQTALEECRENNPGMSETLLKDCARSGAASYSGVRGNGANAGAINTMYGSQTKEGKKGGEMHNNNGYVHINSWLPFIL